MLVNAKDHIQKSIFWYGYYEKNVSLLWNNLVQADSIVLDVGANIGYFSVLIAAKAKNGKVFSFEPVSIARQQLQTNVALNKLHNVIVLPYCVGNKNEPVEMFVADDNNLGMSALQRPENFSGFEEKVACVVVDDWRNQNGIPRINLLKIDIEGGEKNALDGMKELLQADQPIILIEIIDSLLQKFGSSAYEVYGLLQQYGYRPFEIVSPTAVKKIPGVKEGYDILFLPRQCKLPTNIELLE